MLTVLFWPVLGWTALGILLVSHLLVLYPTLNPLSQWLGPVVTRFRCSEPAVWITIDDGPDERDTRRILDLLERYGARATFFAKGNCVAADPELASEIITRGHTVENHSMTHPSATFWCLPPGRIAAEIDRCTEVIEGATGRKPRLFRAPVGMKNPFVHPIVRDRGMRLVGWSARGFDGVMSEPQISAKRILRDVTPGTIILAHEGRIAPDGTAVNYRLLEILLETLQQKGYSAVIPAEEDLL